MVDEQDPAKRVVKRVVKKTVVRPAASPTAPPAPTVRYGRPVATATRPSTSQQPAGAAPRPVAKATAKTKPKVGVASAPKTKRETASVDVGAKVAGARDLVGRAWWATADTVSDGARAVGGFTAARARTVAAWRLPHLNPYLASVVTGAVVGLVAVLLGIASLTVFEAVRGVSSGGGLWGGLVFVAIAVGSVFVGEALLRGFGVGAPRLTSFLAIILTIVAMLGLFLDLVDGVLGLVLVPLLALAGYAASHALLDLAENAPADED